MTALFVAPLSMVGSTALLFAAGTSAIIAFIPLQAMFVGLLAGLTHYAIRKRSCFETSPAFVGILTLLASCITYPLALDGAIPNETPGDWALALFPLLFSSCLVSIGLPCVTIIWACHSRSSAMIIGICFMLGTLAVFNFCLIALCFKGAGEWDLMPYAAFAGTILGSMVCFVLALGRTVQIFFDQIED